MKSYLRYLNRKFTLNEKVLLAIFASAFISVYAVILAAVFLPIYITVTKQWKYVLVPTLENLLLCVFWLLVMVVTAIYGDTKSILLAVCLAFGVVGVLFFSRAMTRQVFVPCLTLSCYLSVISFIVALFQWIMLKTTEHGVRFHSVFVNPNYYGTVIEIVVLFAIYCLLKEQRKERRLVFYIVIAVNIAGLILTQCRTAYIVIILTVPLLLAVVDKNFLYLYAALFVLFIGALVFFPDLLPRLQTIVTDYDRRRDLWVAAWNAFTTHPIFGQGCIAYSRLYSAYGGPSGVHSHNIFLELLLNFGVVGTSLFVTVIGLNMSKIASIYKHRIAQRKFALSLSVLAAVIIHGMLDITFFWPQTAVLVIGVLFYSRNYEFEDVPIGDPSQVKIQ